MFTLIANYLKFTISAYSMKKVSAAVTEKQYNALQKFVNKGIYGSISDAVRDAVRRLIEEKRKEGLI